MEDAVIDQPTEEVVATDQPEIQQQAEPTQDQPSAEEKVDGRKFNPEWSKEFKHLRETYPEKADLLTKWRDDLARFGAIREMAPNGVKDVQAWKQLSDTVGGPEAAATLMERASTLDSIDAKVIAGDASLYDDLPADMQQGFDSIVANRLTAIAESAPEKFAEMVQPHFQKALSGTGLGQLFTQVREAITAGDNAKAAELIGQGENWYKQQTQGVQGGPNQPQRPVDPKVAAMERELNERRESDKSTFVKSITDATNKHLADTFASSADVYIKQLGLTDQQQEDLKESFSGKLVAKLQGDAVFQKQLAAYGKMKSVSPETVQNYVKSKVDEYAKPLMDGIVTSRYGNMLGKRTATPVVAAAASTGGPVRVAQAPSQDQWDMDKMDAAGYHATVKQGLYYLKGGKSVQLIRS